MLPYAVIPAWNIGPLKMNLYGVFFALGVFTAAWMLERAAVARGFKKELVEPLVLWMMLGMMVGARLFYVLFYWPAGMERTLYSTIAVWHGGLAFLGGFLGAAVAAALYLRSKRLKLLEWADLIVVPLLVGHFLGRIGDYLTGGHPGALTDLPWGIYLQGAIRHPVVLYELIGLLVILCIILALQRWRPPTGTLSAAYIILYALQRLVLDFFRLESTDPRILGLTPTQIGLLVLATGVAVLVTRKSIVRNTKAL